jgi:tetratricopeptide (TPR) repeat protein
LRKDAIRVAERGVVLHPGNRDLHARLADLYLQRWDDKGDPSLPGKIRDLNRALIERDPKDPFPHIRLGDLALKQEGFEDAIRHYEKALMLGGGGSQVYLAIGRAQAKLGDDEKAVASFEKAVRHDPDCYPAYDAIADAQERQGQPARAMETLMRWWERERDAMKRHEIRKRYDVIRQRKETGTVGPPDAR